MATIDKRGVAARLRSLMTAPVDQVAQWLHVSEAALRAAVQSLGPRPTVEIVVAASMYYGVDPAWIVAEAYDPDALRAAAEGDLDGTTAAVLKILRTAEFEGALDERGSMRAVRRADQAVTEFSRPARDRVAADRSETESSSRGASTAPLTGSRKPTSREAR